MHLFLLMALLLAAPFWESKEAKDWTDEELLELLTDSPWAQITAFGNSPGVSVYLATAKPMRAAELEAGRRYTSKQPNPQPAENSARLEYEAFLEQSPGKAIVIAIRQPNLIALAEAGETKLMQEESRLKAGGKTYKMTGYFPPAPSDPLLRLVFPRPSMPVKEFSFELYIPGTSGPYRRAVFRTKDLLHRGQPEF
jgi:hypothetical protein